MNIVRHLKKQCERWCDEYRWQRCGGFKKWIKNIYKI